MGFVSFLGSTSFRVAHLFSQRTNDLIEAVKCNDLDQIKAYIRSGKFPINAQDRRGRTALIYAALKQNEKAVRLLLAAGASPNTTDYCQNTALFWGATNSKITKRLLAYGANPNASNDRGRTPLMWAARHGNLESVNALLKKGAHIDTQDKDGCTAALWAAEFESCDVLKELAKQGADLNHKNKYGLGIQFCIKGLNNPKLSQIFKSYSLEGPNQEDKGQSIEIERNRYQERHIAKHTSLCKESQKALREFKKNIHTR